MNKLIVSFILCVLATVLVFAEDPATTMKDASQAINDSHALIDQMAAEGFSIVQLEDILFEAEQIFIAQSTLGEGASYDSIITKTDQIQDISEKAYETKDQLVVLKTKLDGETGDMAEAYALYETAQQEFKDERYDQALDLVDQTYT